MRLFAALLLATSAHAATFTLPEQRPDALDHIEQSRTLRCGLVTAAEDYSMATTHGNLSQFGAALCRATAAAIVNDPARAEMTGFPDDAHALAALHAGRIDLLFGATPDPANMLAYNIQFAPTALFDAQGILVAKSANVHTLADMRGKKLCYITGTEQEARMNAWLASSGIQLLPHDFQERGEMEAALTGGVCDAITDDISALAQMRAGFHAQANDFEIPTETFAIDPWAPAARAIETRLTAAVTHVLGALITAEERNIDTSNLPHPPGGAETLLGPTPGIQTTLGMPNGWATRAIQAGGNYATIYNHTLGKNSPLNLPRGHNALWTQGGMLAAPPLR